MGTSTTPDSIYKPTVGETGWGASVNTGFDNIQTALTARQKIPSSASYADRFVATWGSDSNDGKTWHSAWLTPEFAVTSITSGLGYGTIYIGPGTFNIADTMTIKLGIKIVGAGFSTAAGGGTVLNYTGTDDGRACIRTSSTTAADYSFGYIGGFRMTCQTGYTLAIGLELRNIQNGTVIENLEIVGYPAKGVYAYSAVSTSDAQFPGHVTLRNIWVLGDCALPWHLRWGTCSVRIYDCACDVPTSGTATVNQVVKFDTLPGGSAGDGRCDYVLVGFKIESGRDVNAYEWAAFVPTTMIGCDHRYGSPGTKTAYLYSAAEYASANNPVSAPPLSLINCQSQGTPYIFQATNLTTPISFPTSTAAGITTHINYNGVTMAPAVWQGTQPPMVGTTLSLTSPSATAIPVDIVPNSAQTGSLFRANAQTVTDIFTRADSAVTLGSPTLGAAYTALRGTWGIATNKGYHTTTAPIDDGVAVIDSGFADFIMTCDVTTSGTASKTYAGLVFRALDASNRWRVAIRSSGETFLTKMVAGVNTHIISTFTFAVSTTYSLKVIALGNAISFYINNTLVSSTTDAFNNTQTSHGLYLNGGAATDFDDSGSRFDNLAIYTPSFAVSSGGLASFGQTQTTVGAAGAASAVPATPTKYLKVQDGSGNTYVIPAFLPS
jgi:hypothetical protein